MQFNWKTIWFWRVKMFRVFSSSVKSLPSKTGWQNVEEREEPQKSEKRVKKFLRSHQNSELSSEWKKEGNVEKLEWKWMLNHNFHSKNPFLLIFSYYFLFLPQCSLRFQCNHPIMHQITLMWSKSSKANEWAYRKSVQRRIKILEENPII